MMTIRHADQQRLRTLLILWACALVSVCAAFATHFAQRLARGEAVIAAAVLPNFAQDLPQVRTIAITTPQGTYSLVRRANKWVMPERDNYPVSTQALSEFARDLSNLKFKALRTSDPAQFAQLGVADLSQPLSEPLNQGAQIRIKNATGFALHDLFMGQNAQAVFVRKAGTNDVYEADGMLPPFANLAHFLDLKVLDITADTIASVSGGRSNEARYDIVRRPDGGFAPVGGSANVTATTAAIALTTWEPQDVIAASALTSDPIATHTTNLRSGILIQISAYQEQGRNWVVVSANATDLSGQEAAAQINVRTDNWAFALDATSFENFTFSTQAIVNGPAASPLDQTNPLP